MLDIFVQKDPDNIVKALFGGEAEGQSPAGIEPFRPAGNDLLNRRVRLMADQFDGGIPAMPAEGFDLLTDGCCPSRRHAPDSRRQRVDWRTSGVPLY